MEIGQRAQCAKGVAGHLFDGAAPAPLDVLKRVYGYSAFRDRQQEVVEHVAAGGDAVVLFPTGAGKSLCFQIPALCRPASASSFRR